MIIYKLQYKILEGIHELRIYPFEAEEKNKSYHLPGEGRRISKDMIGKISGDVILDSVSHFGLVCWTLDTDSLEEISKQMQERAKEFILLMNSKLKALTDAFGNDMSIVYKEADK